MKWLLRARMMLEMIRFSHTLFAMPFALLAAIMAWVTPAEPAIEFRWAVLAGILLAMVGARSAAMAFNRLIDWRWDASNPRTSNRHLPSGKVSGFSVVVFVLVASAVYFGSTLLFWPNWLPLALSVPVLGVLLGYSFAKRFTRLSHVWLGVALMLAPVCAWVAVRGEAVLLDPWDLTPALILGLGVMFWVTGFDVLYACQDCDFDRQAGLHSIPAALGVPGALRCAAAVHAVAVVCFGLVVMTPMWGGPEVPLGWLYAAGVAGIAGLLVLEHRLVRPDDLSRVNAAFFQVNVIISVGLLVIGTIDLLWIKE
ncbi:MAG TPA: UbiA-like polyprenyltransferase [Pirellulaceae bacterium]|nr:UbiA-like polyprenyltransferase [Pirellulaceae bacterium]